MNENLIEPFYKAIQDKQEELKQYVNKQIDAIIIPEQSAVKQEKQPVKTSNVPGGCIVAGIIAAATGIAIGKTVLTVGGIAVIVVGGLLFLNKKGNNKMPAPDSIDYDSISNELFQTLKNINKHVSDSWYEYTGKQKELLKNQISTSDIEVDKRQDMLEKSLKRSVVDVSMTQILSELSGLSRQKNSREYCQYLIIIKSRIDSAIEQAYNEQVKIYQAVEDASK